MSRSALTVTNLGKKYYLGASPAKENGNERSLAQRVSPSHRRRRREDASFWALKDVSFDVAEGEVLGVVGRNGAGKSTLLKILSRVVVPTTGKARMRGRVGSLLEVGTGFHPELTGRENIFLNGAILGMRKAEIERQFDEIVAFSEIEKFIDTPVKRYSSGMYVRLAFSVAAHLEPEILLVDEVLAVGDYGFQRKCLGRLGETARQGRTVFMVSHNLGAINRLCSRAIWINEGQIVLDGSPEHVTSRYLMEGAGDSGTRSWEGGYSESEELRIYSVSLRDENNAISAQQDIRKRFSLEIDYEITTPLPFCRIGFSILTGDGVVVFETFDTDGGNVGERLPGRYVARCEIPGDFLNSGQHFVTVRAGMPRVKPLAHLESVLAFVVEDMGAVGQELVLRRAGIVRPLLQWKSTVAEPSR